MRIALTLLGVAFFSLTSFAQKQQKVAICHKGKTIYVAQPAVQAHLNHGDYVGSCGDNQISERQRQVEIGDREEQENRRDREEEQRQRRQSDEEETEVTRRRGETNPDKESRSGDIKIEPKYPEEEAEEIPEEPRKEQENGTIKRDGANSPTTRRDRDANTKSEAGVRTEQEQKATRRSKAILRYRQ